MEQVLFLCTGNYYRSRLAEEYFNHLIEIHGLPFKAISRGICQQLDNNGNIGNRASEVVEILDGINVKCHTLGRKPQSVKLSELRDSHYIFALDVIEYQPMINRDFADFSKKIQYMTVGDIQFEPVYVAVVKLIKQVDELFNNLSNTSTK